MTGRRWGSRERRAELGSQGKAPESGERGTTPLGNGHSLKLPELRECWDTALSRRVWAVLRGAKGWTLIPVHPFQFGTFHISMTHVVAHGLKEVLTLSSSPKKQNALHCVLSPLLHLRAALDIDPLCMLCYESKHGPLYTSGRRTSHAS